jgi:hypothetical protein
MALYLDPVDPDADPAVSFEPPKALTAEDPDRAARPLLEHYEAPPCIARHRVILLIDGVHRGTLAALRYAQRLSEDLTAVHVAFEAAEAQKVREEWELWGEGVRLVILASPNRSLLEPLFQYLEEITAQPQPNEVLTIVVPQLAPRHRRHHFLHTPTALLRLALQFKSDLVVTVVPYHLD